MAGKRKEGEKMFPTAKRIKAEQEKIRKGRLLWINNQLEEIRNKVRSREITAKKALELVGDLEKENADILKK